MCVSAPGETGWMQGVSAHSKGEPALFKWCSTKRAAVVLVEKEEVAVCQDSGWKKVRGWGPMFWKVKMETSCDLALVPGRDWPKTSKLAQPAGEPQRFANRRCGGGGWEGLTGRVVEKPPSGKPRRSWGDLQTGEACPQESQVGREVCASAQCASPRRSTAWGLVIALPTLRLLHGVLEHRESHCGGPWQGSLWVGLASVDASLQQHAPMAGVG